MAANIAPTCLDGESPLPPRKRTKRRAPQYHAGNLSLQDLSSNNLECVVLDVCRTTLSSLFPVLTKTYVLLEPLDCTAGLDTEEAVTEQPAKKQRKKAQTREYLPGVGTANYAFMIALFQVNIQAF